MRALRIGALLAMFCAFSAGMVTGQVTSRPEPLRGERDETPLTFAEAAALALAASDELRAEYVLRSLREGAWVLGFRAYLPHVSLSAGEDDRLSTAGPDSFTKTFSLQANQLLWDGGRTKTARLLESAELELARADLDRKARDLAEAAISACRSVLAQREYLAIKESSVEYLREQRRVLAVEVETGLALREDLLAAELSVGEAELGVKVAKLELEEAERSLAESLGLERLPPLADRVDVDRVGVTVDSEAAADAARSSNPELATARLTVEKARVEAREAARTWVPTLNLTAGASLSGDTYPLTRSSWNVGVNLAFSGPFLSGSAEASAGWEPPYDRTARTAAKAEPLPDPAAFADVRSAETALRLQTELYAAAVEKSGRAAALAAERVVIADRRRALAKDAGEIAIRKLELAELRRQLGRATRVDLMELRLEAAEKEIALVEAAVAVLAAERELERMLDLAPGELAAFAARTKKGRP